MNILSPAAPANDSQAPLQKTYYNGNASRRLSWPFHPPTAPMRICIVYHGQYPPEERIEKISKSLSLAGHQIFVLCNNLGGYKVHEEEYRNTTVIRIGPTFATRRWNKLLKFPIDFNPLWLGRLISVVRRFRIDALHVVDIPLSVATLGVARWRG